MAGTLLSANNRNCLYNKRDFTKEMFNHCLKLDLMSKNISVPLHPVKMFCALAYLCMKLHNMPPIAKFIFPPTRAFL